MIEDIQDTVLWIIASSNSSETDVIKNSKSKPDALVSSRCRDHFYGGPLCRAAFEKLSIMRNSQHWADVELEPMATLVELLRDHVVNATSIDLFRGAENGPQDSQDKIHKRDVSFQIAVLKSGLEAALTLAFIATSPGLDRTIISDRIICSCIALIRHHMLQHIIPALSPIDLILNKIDSPQVSEKTDAVAEVGKLGMFSSTDILRRDTLDNRPSRKRSIHKISAEKNIQNITTLHSFICDLSQNIFTSIDIFTSLLGRMEYVCRTVHVEDQYLLVIIDTCLRPITLDPYCSSSVHPSQALSLIRSLQSCVMSLLSNIFHSHSQLREGILQDLFPLILNLPSSSKKSIRYFQVSSYYGRCVSSGNASPNNSILSNHYRLDVHVQTLSILVLMLIQSCVHMPDASNLEGISDHTQVHDPTNSSKKTVLLITQDTMQGLGYCKKVIAYLVTEIVSRCNRNNDESSEYRIFLTNFIEDLLMVNLNPEYPAAESVLYVVCHHLLDMILQSTTNRSLNKTNTKTILVEGSFLVSALDILGSVTADLAYKRVCFRNYPVKLPKTPLDAIEQRIDKSTINLDERNGVDFYSNEFCLTADDCQCFCNRKFIDTFMLDCDNCHKWFHGSCVGITRDRPMKIWMCDDCTLNEHVMKQATSLCATSNHATDQPFSQRDHIQIMRFVLLQALTKSCLSTNTACIRLQYARWYWLAQWMNSSASPKQGNDVIEPKMVSRRFLSDWYLHQPIRQNHSILQSIAVPSILEMHANILLSLFCSTSAIASLYPQLLGFVIAINGDQSTNLRKAAVKALAEVIDVDSHLINQREVRDAIAKLFVDEAISVREAAITLVATYMSSVPQLCNLFHGILLDRLKNDSGVSVRKRVVKIFRELILCQNNNYRGRSAASVAMLERMIDPKEDDSVRDLIHQTFSTLWFDPYLSSQYHIVNGSSTTVKRDNLASSIAKQLVDVVKISENPTHIVSLIRELSTCSSSTKSSSRKNGKEKNLVKKGETVTKDGSIYPLSCTLESDYYHIVPDVVKHMHYVASSLMDQLLSFEGDQIIEKKLHDKATPASGDDLVAVIRTISVFAESAPFTIIKHIDTLLPFLKADNGVKEDYESTVVLHVCKILCTLVNTTNTFELKKLSHQSLIEDLNQIVYRFGSTAMSASIELMARLSEKCVVEANMENIHDRNLLQLASKFYSYLLRTKYSREHLTHLSSKVISNLHRSMAGLGFICRFHKFTRSSKYTNTNDLIIVPLSELKWPSIAASSFCIFEHYFFQGDTSIRCHALRAITAVCIAEPRLLLAAEEGGLFSRSMCVDCDVDILTSCLGCWKEMLISEELRISNGDARNEMLQRDVTLSEQISGDQDGDASLFGSCCIQHSRALLELSLHKNYLVRFQTLSLIDVLLRQGLMNPMEVIPYLFCLQGDFEINIQQYSLKLLLREGDRRPYMLRQRLYIGLCGAFQFQRMIKGNVRPTALFDDPNVNCSQVQKCCIASEIFKQFILPSQSQCVKILTTLVESLQLLSIPKSMVSLDISSEKEKSERILFHCFISEIIAHFPYNNLGDLLFVINLIDSKVAIDGFSLANAFESLLVNTVPVCANFKDSKENSKVEKAIMKALENRSIRCSEFMELCERASPVILLMRTKLFLCKTYGVTEARLREYQQGSKDYVGDKVVHQPEDTGLFCCALPSSLDEHGQSSIYVQFKTLSRNYSS